MGFTGKQVIHPDQVPVVQQAFAPSPQQVEWARGLIQAFQEHQALGKVCVCVCGRMERESLRRERALVKFLLLHVQGAFAYQGMSIDMPLLLQAQNIIRLTKLLKD